MKYIVQEIDGNKTTSTGKAYHKVTLASGSELHEGVAIWSDFPNFNSITFETEVEGDVVIKQNGQYVNKTLYPLKPASTGHTRGSGAITKAMETKASNIRDAQENKENGIKLSSTIRMAVDITLARDLGSTEDIQAEIEYWRKWLWKTWDEPADKQWPTV